MGRDRTTGDGGAQAGAPAPGSSARAGAARAAVFVLVVVAVLTCDQLAKHAARDLLSVGAAVELVPGVLGLTLVQNYGAAFSILGGARWLLVGLAAVSSVLCLVAAARRWLSGRLADVSLALVFSGAVGNAVDRVAFGYVTDFLRTLFVSFPVFNVADISLVVGFFLLLLAYVREGRSHE